MMYTMSCAGDKGNKEAQRSRGREEKEKRKALR
jgi:hypothetical protein